MKLGNFLKRSKITRSDFARQIGVDRVTVWRWETGQSFPIRHLAKIARVTGDKVRANDFVEHEASQ